MEDKRDPNLRELFSEYKKHPCLWDPAHPQFGDNYVRKSAWPLMRKIYVEKCNTSDAATSMNVVMDRYAKQFHDEEKRRQAHAGKDTPYQPQFLYYEDLQFLKGMKQQTPKKVKTQESKNDKWDKWAEKMRDLSAAEQEKMDSIIKGMYELCRPSESGEQPDGEATNVQNSPGPSGKGKGKKQ